MNLMRTGLLLAGLTGLFLAVGYLIGGQAGMFMALAFSIAMNVFSWWKSDTMVLAMHGAEQVDAATAPDFYALVENLAQQAGLPMPKVFVIHEDQPNAFATGRNPQNAAIAATTGLMARLSREELAGVIAHELSHIRNRDTLTMTMTATLAGAISMLANFALFFGGGRNRDHPLGIIGTIAMMILAPMAAMLVQMAISRTREYAADRGGAEICGNPLWLAAALGKIDAAAQVIENPRAEANPATAHMFIINPLSGARMDNLFTTHPATENRIAALRQLAAQWGPGTPTRATTPSGAPDRVPAGDAETYPGPWSTTGRRQRGPWG